MRYSVRDGLTAIKSRYRTARQEYERVSEELHECFEKQNRLPYDLNLSVKGKENEKARLASRIDELRGKLDNIQKSAAESFARERQTIQSRFDGLYGLHAKQLDPDVIALCESGVVKPSEFIQLANKHRDKPALCRIIGKCAAEQYPDNRSMQRLATEAQQDYAPHLAAADRLIDWSLRGIGARSEHELSGEASIRMANAYDTRYDSIYDEVINSAPDAVYNMDVLKPGNPWYSTESD